MSYTQSQIDTLESALASGALQVRYADGKMVTYRSLAEMRVILGDMRTAVAGPLLRRSRAVYPSFSRFPCTDPAG